MYSASQKQRINTKSSTEAEVVGTDDGMPLIIWMKNFLTAQGFNVLDNIVYQDNQSTMLLERNGRASSGRCTRHMNVRYFFIADRIKNKELHIKYCPTNDMLADFFTKPLQGAQFRKLRNAIMNIPADPPLPISLSQSPASQECVGTRMSRTYADALQGTDMSTTSNGLKNAAADSTNDVPNSST